MKITGSLDSMKIHAPQVRPFVQRELVTCPACGICPHSKWRRFLRYLKGKNTEFVVTMRYCPGDKPPTEEKMGFLVFTPMEVANQCSGIPVPHLHCHCTMCQAEWYCEVREPA